MNPIPNEACAHDACGCKVEQRGQFCSDSCRTQSVDPVGGKTCECGHSDCVVEQALRRAGQD